MFGWLNLGKAKTSENKIVHLRGSNIYIYDINTFLAPKYFCVKCRLFLIPLLFLYNKDTFWLISRCEEPCYISFRSVLELSCTFIFWRQNISYLVHRKGSCLENIKMDWCRPIPGIKMFSKTSFELTGIKMFSKTSFELGEYLENI